MARLYHVDIARHVASADHKWVDNLLSHFNIPGVDGGRRDPRDEFPPTALPTSRWVRTLNRELGLSVAAAVRVADRLLGANATELSIGNGLELRLDLAAFRSSVERAIADGVEVDHARAARTTAKTRSSSALKASAGHHLGAPLAGKTNAYAIAIAQQPLLTFSGSRSFLALHEVELHGFTLGQRLEAIARDRARSGRSSPCLHRPV